MKKSLCCFLCMLLLLSGMPGSRASEVSESPAIDQTQSVLDEDSNEEAIRDQILALFEEDAQPDDAQAASVEIKDDELMINEDLDEAWINILLMGTDDRSYKTNTRTDSMIILSIHEQTLQVKMTSIMRDIWVQLPKKGGQKINAANVFGGPNLAMRTVNEYFGLNIRQYVLINMQGLSNIIDSVGGIDLDISSGERRWINAYLAEYRRFTGKDSLDQNPDGRKDLTASGPGTHVSGAQATAYCRNRYMGNDQQRTQRQRTVLMALAQKAKQSGLDTLLTLIPAMLQSVQTNLSAKEVAELAILAFGADLSKVEQERLPFAGTFRSGMFGSVWCIKPNFEANAQQLREFIYGTP